GARRNRYFLRSAGPTVEIDIRFHEPAADVTKIKIGVVAGTRGGMRKDENSSGRIDSSIQNGRVLPVAPGHLRASHRSDSFNCQKPQWEVGKLKKRGHR